MYEDFAYIPCGADDWTALLVDTVDYAEELALIEACELSINNEVQA